MRFLLDENVDYRLLAYLAQHSHDAVFLTEGYTYGLTDVHVLRIAEQNHRILLTNDKDFGELIFRRHLPHCGVLLFRLKDETLANVKHAYSRCLPNTQISYTIFWLSPNNGSGYANPSIKLLLKRFLTSPSHCPTPAFQAR